MKRMMLFSAAVAAGLLLIPSTQAQVLHPPPTNSEFQIRAGLFIPEGGGGFWNEVEDTFTIDASDFNDFALGFSYVQGLSNNFEVGFNVDFFDDTVLSEYRDFTDAGGFPVLHDSELSTVPITVDVRFIPGGRFRNRGPRQVLQPVFYLGGGAGLVLFEYEEFGDFIDFADPGLPVFYGEFRDRGVAPETHVLAGLEFPAGPRFNLIVEGRYSWASQDLEDDFAGLGDIELGGTSLYIGGGWRF